MDSIFSHWSFWIFDCQIGKDKERMTSDERSLIAKAKDNDKEAFAALVGQHQNRIFAFIMRMTANRETALDLTQDTFLAAYQNLNTFRGEASFSTWLFQIAGNKVKNFRKKAQRESPLPSNYDQVPSSADPGTDWEQKEQNRRLLKAISDLPEKQKAAFNLRFLEQFKFEEIAQIQHCSVSAVKTNFAEAVKKLKDKLNVK